MALILTGTMLASEMPAMVLYAKENEVQVESSDNGNKKVISTTYYDPQKWTENWREAMVSGNGENGVLESGVPANDTFIFQNIKFNMPTDDLRETQDLYTELNEARSAVMSKSQFYSSVQPELDYDYSFHPGSQLRVKRDDQSGNITDYQRYTDYETAEIGVEYTDAGGIWLSRTFSSREDNVTISFYEKSSEGQKLNLTLSLDDLSDMAVDSSSSGINEKLRYKKLADEDGAYLGLVGHYPVYENSELKNGGYAGITYVMTIGGTKERVILGTESDNLYAGSDKANYGVQIQDADAVVLVTKSDRDVNLGDYDAFADETTWDLVDHLIADTKSVMEKYTQNQSFDYDAALAAHAKIHGAEFNKVQFELDGDNADEQLTNEQLIDKQRANSGTLNQSMAERAFYAGRYAQICASGYSTSRLGGMWTGAWNPYWQGDYTTDANVNLQISGVNIGHMEEAAQGYISFILRIADDFEANAKQVYGMHDAIMAPPRTDGDNGSLVHFNADYPFNYWNAGASWLLLPIYEYWQCYGNQEIPIGKDVDIESLKSVLSVSDEDLTEAQIQAIMEKGTLDLENEILLSLLTKGANFWEQLTDPTYYVDSEGYMHHDESKQTLDIEAGERYLLLPGYSPENAPSNTWNAISANTTMDVSAARSNLKMLISLYEKQGNAKAAEKWSNLETQLPDYQYSWDGALKEWAVQDYSEQDNHRHVSHMYPVWPEHEAQQDEEIMNGAIKALENRKKYNTGDDNASHGWLHQALAEARMKQGDHVEEILCGLMSSSRLFYSSMMTNHDKWRTSAYCTDASITMPAIMLEALAYSDTGVIEVLPALPGNWNSGSISGVMARTQAEITNLTWNIEEGSAVVQICPNQDQKLTLKCGQKWDQAEITSGQEAEMISGEEIVVQAKAGELIEVTFWLMQGVELSVPDSVRSGETAQFQAEVYPLSLDNREVQWSVENVDGNAYIDQDGRLYARKAGTVLVKAAAAADASFVTTVEYRILPGIFEGNKLSGTIFGRTDTYWEQQSPPENAFDGNTNTFYDGDTGSYVGIALEEAVPLTGVRIVARGDGYQDRMPGIQIQGSDNQENWDTLYTIQQGDILANPEYITICLPVSGETSSEYKYYRLYNENYVNVAEIEFWGDLTGSPKMALKALIQKLKNVNAEYYTEESMVKLKEALQTAEIAAADETSTEEALREETAKLQNVFDRMDKVWILSMDPEIIRHGCWREWSDSEIKSGTELYTEVPGDSIEFTFRGTGFEMYSNKNPGLGYAELYVDGNRIDEEISMYQSWEPGSKNQFITAVSGLRYQTHTVKIVLADKENPRGATKISIDAFKVLRETSIPTYSVTVAANDDVMGTVLLSPEQESYEEGTKVTVTAAANKGFEFAGWTEKGSDTIFSTQTTYTFPVTKDMELVANFKKIQLPYKDVKEDDWFYREVAYVYANEIMTGLTPDTFGPSETLNRAQATVVLWRMAGKPKADSGNKFPDAEEDSWYAEAVNWAAEEEIVTGYENGLFGPGDVLTREQAVAILWRFAKVKGFDVSAKAELGTYQDSDCVQAFAEEAMQWAVGSNIVKGKDEETRLDPQGSITRAEFGAIATRFMKAYMKSM